MTQPEPPQPEPEDLSDEERVHLVERGALPGSAASAEELGLVPDDAPDDEAEPEAESPRADDPQAEPRPDDDDDDKEEG